MNAPAAANRSQLNAAPRERESPAGAGGEQITGEREANFFIAALREAVDGGAGRGEPE